MAQYLIIKCDELGDQWECDANRTPICLTDDYSKYWILGYEVYEVLPNNRFKLIKDYETCGKEGFAVYWWGKNEDPMVNRKPHILEKLKKEIKDRDQITKSMIKQIKAKYGFHGTIDEIYGEIQMGGAYGELLDDGRYVVFGHYMDERFSTSY